MPEQQNKKKPDRRSGKVTAAAGRVVVASTILVVLGSVLSVIGTGLKHFFGLFVPPADASHWGGWVFYAAAAAVLPVLIGLIVLKTHAPPPHPKTVKLAREAVNRFLHEGSANG